MHKVHGPPTTTYYNRSRQYVTVLQLSMVITKRCVVSAGGGESGRRRILVSFLFMCWLANGLEMTSGLS